MTRNLARYFRHPAHLLWWSLTPFCYQDSDSNTILMLLADFKPPVITPYRSTSNDCYSSGAALRMARLYYDRYPYVRDWANSQGKTALHVAAMQGNEEIVQVPDLPSLMKRSVQTLC